MFIKLSFSKTIIFISYFVIHQFLLNLSYVKNPYVTKAQRYLGLYMIFGGCPVPINLRKL